MQTTSPDRLASSPDLPGTESRVAAIAGLRVCLTLLVIAHHAVLAYNPYAPPPAGLTGDMLWAAFPIVDAARWKGSEVFTLWNDSYFMALFFLVSGLFVWPALARKGAGGFARGRLVRLGIPFLFAAGLVAPLAYYPAHAAAAGLADVGGFWAKWRALGVWPAGPAWFLWVLLAFSLVAALVHRVAPSWGGRAAALAAGWKEHPVRAALLLGGVAVVTYQAGAWLANPLTWGSWGPFFVQTARLGWYFAFFAFGAAVGAAGLDRGLLAAEGRLARRWWGWGTVATGVFFVFVVALVAVFTLAAKGGAPTALVLATNASFALTGVASSFAMLAFYARWCRRAGRATASLDRNAFAMYLVHYPIVSWLQFALLPVALPGAAKGGLAIAGAVAASWLVAAALRRVPGVARVI